VNRGHLSDIERGKREAGIITLQVITRGLDDGQKAPLCIPRPPW
jgi:hypothetical protein